MITPAYSPTATERVLPRMALDFTTAVLDARVAVTRALNTATRINSNGVIEIVNANLPRFDYDPSTLICKGLLIEEARSNLLLNSLIDGTNLTTQIVTLTATSYALSFYGTGSITITGGHIATVTGTGNYPNRVTYLFTPTAGVSTFTVSGDVKFAQLEAGSFATSFIPTAATSVTRNLDDVRITGTNFSSFYNASQGAMIAYFDTVTLNAASVIGRNILAVNTSTTNVIQSYIYSNYIGAKMVSAGALQFDNTTGGSPANNVTIKTGIAYAANNCYATTNAGAGFASTTVTLPSPTPTQLLIGMGNLNSPICGHMQKVFYYPQRLTNAEMQALTK